MLDLSGAVDLWRRRRGMMPAELALAAQVFPEDLEHLSETFEQDPQRLERLARALGTSFSSLIRTAAEITHGARPIAPEDLEQLLG